MAKAPYNPEPEYRVEKVGDYEMIGIVCADYTVRATQIFHFQDLYRMIFHWLVEHEYTDLRGNRFQDMKPETLFYEKRPDMGKEHFIWWRVQKKIEYNSYFQRRMNINFKTRKMKDVQLISHDKKGTFQDGEIWIYVTAILELDYQRTWRNHWLMKHFHEWYWKKLFWKQFDRHRVRTYREAFELERAIKEYLGIFQFHKERVPWRPPFGKQDTELASH
ncbi:hypothetical protein HZB01_05680 [Candidatus Woesearchaeota archaeon]|nr:hypothetical protein [Candidatus Woesearchaeota archaeon]